MSKYFKSKIRKSFLAYFLCFRSSVHFREHSGYLCSERYLKTMKSDLLALENAHAEAKARLDFEALAEIEMGLFDSSI